MSIQLIEASKGKEFVPTYTGRFLKERFEKDPKYKKRIPRRWLTMEYVEEKECKG